MSKDKDVIVEQPDTVITDDDGTEWRSNSFKRQDGAGDTYGPGHPAIPTKLKVIEKIEEDRRARRA